MLDGKPVLTTAVPIQALSRRIKLTAVEGEPAEMFRLTAEGKGIIISDSLSLLRKLHKGDTVTLASPYGELRLPVAGTSIDFSDQQGSILMDRDFYIRHWKDETVDIFRIYLKPGAQPEDVRRRIIERFSANSKLFVYTNQGIRDYDMQLTGQWFGMTYVQLFVSVIVAILGIVNTLTVSIMDRRRELGVLQAVGGLRNQIRHTVWMEAAAIGLIGLLLGLGMGAVMLYYNIDMLRRDIGGVRLSFEYPFQFALFLFPVILGAAFLSALWPAESAVRASLVESLEYE
jgi:putative ABC transport system permease protein